MQVFQRTQHSQTSHPQLPQQSTDPESHREADKIAVTELTQILLDKTTDTQKTQSVKDTVVQVHNLTVQINASNQAEAAYGHFGAFPTGDGFESREKSFYVGYPSLSADKRAVLILTNALKQIAASKSNVHRTTEVASNSASNSSLDQAETQLSFLCMQQSLEYEPAKNLAKALEAMGMRLAYVEVGHDMAKLVFQQLPCDVTPDIALNRVQLSIEPLLAGYAVLLPFLKKTEPAPSLKFTEQSLDTVLHQRVIEQILDSKIKLQKLHLREVTLKGNAEFFNQRLRQVTSLTSLHLDKLGEDKKGQPIIGQVINTLESMTSLTELGVREETLNAKMITSVFDGMPSLKKLSIMDVEFEGRGSSGLIEEKLQKNTSTAASLISLKLDSNKMSKAKLEPLMNSLQKVTSLTDICINEEQMTTEMVARFIDGLRENISLRSLELGADYGSIENQPTPALVEQALLNSLKNNSTLTRLQLNTMRPASFFLPLGELGLSAPVKEALSANQAAADQKS